MIPMINYPERDLDEPKCRRCELPASWCQCEPDIDRFPEDDPVQTDTQQQRALASHDPVQEPWHLEPPDTEAEDRKERDWSELEAVARDFVKTYGGAAMMRCVSAALK